MIAALYFIVLFVFSATSLYKLGLVLCFLRGRGRERHPVAPPAELPFVTIQIPVYNERGVIRRILGAALSIDYPADRLEIQVLDDSTDDTSAIISEFPVLHIRRPARDGYKAGALAAGLATARGSLIAIFDADFVPPADFLMRTIGYFNYADVGMVQARWSFLNETRSLLTRAQGIFLDAHFVIEHGARSRAGLFFNFNGTAGVWRREAIAAAGGWSGDTLTEDLDLSYRAQLAGWRFVFLPTVTVPSDLPECLASLKQQQFRWAKGMTQVALKLLPSIWRSDESAWRKVDATFNLTSGLGYLATSAAALLLIPFLLTHAISRELAAGLVGLNLAGSIGYYLLARRARDFWTVLAMVPIGIGLSLNGAVAVLEALAGMRSPFLRTPKAGYGGARPRGVALEAALFLVYVGAAFRVGSAQLPPIVLFGSGYAMLLAYARRSPA